MFHLVVDFCSTEHVPKEDSLTYQRLLVEKGVHEADKHTYEVIFPPYEQMEGELKQCADIILNGYLPGGKRIEQQMV